MITVASAPLTATFLVSIRLGMVILFSPIQAIRLLSLHTRLLFVLILSSLIAANLPTSFTKANDLSLLLSGLAECGNGLMLALSIYAAYAVFHLAGFLIDTQMGLNSLAILNPTNNSHELLTSRLLSMLAVLFFFSLDNHLKLLQGLLASFFIIPPGKHLLFNGFAPLTHYASFMFSLSLMIASPLLIGLLLVDIFGAILTRNMPQISAYFLTLPIKILLGLFIFILLLNYLNPLIEHVFQFCFQSFTQVIL